MSPAKKPAGGEVKTVPALEWILVTVEDFRLALPAMMRFRKVNLEELGHRMATTPGIPRLLFAGFLRRSQRSVKLESFLDAMDAMDLEVVVRRKSTKMSQRRLEALRARVDREYTEAELAAQGRDAQGRLLDVSSLTDQQRAEIDALLDKNGSFE